MGDPFWRRFSSAKERGVSDDGNLSTRSQSVGPAGESPGKSRNDLFSTDWKWKGKNAEEQSRVTALDRGAIQYDNQEPARNRDNTAVHPVSGRMEPEPPLPSLGAPIQLEPSATPRKSPESRASPSLASGGASGRLSRNDSIYNVNHLTITPPRTSSINDTPAALIRSPEVYSSGVSRASGKQYDRVAVGEPTRSSGQSPLSREEDTKPDRVDVAPTRSESTELSTSSEAIRDSAITSFTDKAGTPNIGRVPVTGQSPQTMTYGSSGSHYSRPPSPWMSPVTPFTPAASRPAGTTLLLSEDNNSRETRAVDRIMDGSMPFGMQGPQTGLSLSRSSSMTISQSPSRALANVARKAEILLADSDGEDSADMEPRIGNAPARGETDVTRVRMDITSRQWLIGYGRYAKVFLGSYKTAAAPLSTGWQLCAGKVFDADAESVDMARKEDSVLRYLHQDDPMSAEDTHTDGRQFIMECIALVDETATECPPATYDLSQPSSATGTPRGSNTRVTPNGPASRRTSTEDDSYAPGRVRAVYTSAGAHSRSTSETRAMLRQLRRRAADRKSADISLYRPILLLPLYAKGSMATFIKTQATDGVDHALWSTWFQQGLCALSWCKRKDVLHNDIKASLPTGRTRLALISYSAGQFSCMYSGPAFTPY